MRDPIPWRQMIRLRGHWSWMPPGVCLVALAVGPVACMGTNSTRCVNGNEEWFCPADMECYDSLRCVTPVQIKQCTDKEELTPCEIPGVPKGSMRCRHKACVIPYCGDEIIDDGEQCDGNTLGGKTCESLQYDVGIPACKDDCSGFSVDGCSTSGFVHINKGTFMMGSPTSEPCREIDETQHQVTLTHSFEISAYEVTQEAFEALMGYNPAGFTSCGADCPVDSVNWHEAAAYCNALSARTGLQACYSCSGSGASTTCSDAAAYSGQKIYDCPGYRLPTEAEFEYAYRAGSSVAFYPSDGNNGSIANCTSSDPNADRIGWYGFNSSRTTHPVGQKAPNDWGLYDMAGNIWEWCHDWYQEDLGSLEVTAPWGAASGSNRVLRGGAWLYDTHFMRAARRNLNSPPSFSFFTFGFRPCRTKR